VNRHCKKRQRKTTPKIEVKPRQAGGRSFQRLNPIAAIAQKATCTCRMSKQSRDMSATLVLRFPLISSQAFSARLNSAFLNSVLLSPSQLSSSKLFPALLSSSPTLLNPSQLRSLSSSRRQVPFLLRERATPRSGGVALPCKKPSA